MYNLIKKLLKKIKLWQLFLSLFFLINLFFLENFPFVHSDEAWLSGLSRQIMAAENLSSTESFFDLLPRYPHGLKIFFHLLQILFIKIMGYKIFSFRLISLIAALFTAYIFYQSSYLITKSKKTAAAALLILLVDLQFIYSSHLARQEAILLLIYSAAVLYFLKNQLKLKSNKIIKTQEQISSQKSNKEKTILKKELKSGVKKSRTDIKNIKSGIENIKLFINSIKSAIKNIKNEIILALILALAIGFHPNAFIISLPFILIYSFQFFRGKISFKKYFSFGFSLSLAAAFFVYFSFQLDPKFISHYLSYGSSLGVLDSIFLKLKNLKLFYLKLFHQVSGTYYLPQIKFQLLFFIIVIFSSLIKIFFFKKDKINCFLLFNLIALNLGYLLIGRYNQTSIIFIFPISYLLFINLSKNLNFKLKYSLIWLLIIILSLNTIPALIKDSHFNYDNYLKEIAAVVKKDERVLANLNSDYYFENGSLYDYRNLAYLKSNNLSFAEYIRKNKIKYIIYPEEMDFIYNSRPKWNLLYGNLYPYYSEMQHFIKENSSLVKSFNNSTYGIRITEKIGQKDWEIKIYQIDKSFSSSYK